MSAERRMDLRVIGRAGAQRARGLKLQEEAEAAIVAEIRAAGELANVVTASKVSGVPRSTLYRRLGKGSSS